MKTICFLALAAMTMAFAPAALAAPAKITNCPRTITQPGIYEVQGNLDSVGTCIFVRADSVTIDLNGYRIRGNGTGSAIADISTVRGTTVRNGTVTNFENAIQIVGAASVDNVKSFDNAGVGILVGLGAVRNSHAEGNASDGIMVGPRSLVTGNISVRNRSGISATQGSIVRGNTVSENTHGGIMTSGIGLSISSNTVVGNGNFGIAVDCPSLVLGNTALLHSTNLIVTAGAGCKDESNVVQ